MLRQTFVATGDIPELKAHEGDLVEFDPTRRTPILIIRRHSWDAAAHLTHPNLRFLSAHPADAAPRPRALRAQTPRARRRHLSAV